MKEKISKYKTLIILLLIGVIVYFRWLSFNVFSNEDWWFYFSETMRDYLNPSVLVVNKLAGVSDMSLFRVPLNFFIGIFGYFEGNLNVAEKFFYFWPFVFLMPLGAYHFSFYLFKDRWAAFIGALVFCFNTYFINIATHGHLSLTTSSIFALWAIYFFFRAYDEKSWRWALGAFLALIIAGAYDFRLTYISLWIIFFYWLFSVAITFRWEWENVKIRTKFFFSVGFLTILGNLYWIWPFYAQNELTQNEVLSRGIMGNNFFLDISRSFTLFHPFWTGSAPKWFKAQPIPIYFWIIPALVFLSVWLRRKDKRTIFFGFLALLGILLAKQEADPLGSLYPWLYKKLPGFNVFREASKFYFIIALSYSMLLAGLVSWLNNRAQKSPGYKKASFLVVALISIIFLWNTRGILDGSIKTIFLPKIIGQEELELHDFWRKQPEFFRILWVPSESHWAYFSNLHPQINATEMKRSLWESFSHNYGQGDSMETRDRLIYTLSQPMSGQLLNMYSIKYVAVIERDRQYYDDKISKLSYLEKKDFNGAVSVYENKDFFPPLYLTKNIPTIERYFSYQNVAFKNISPAQYEISLKNIKEPVYLNFSYQYDQGWKLRVGDFSWWKSIFEKKYFYPEDNHWTNDAKLNSFRIDPEYLKKNNSSQIISNPDGSIDINLTLYYKSQSYLYLGLVLFVLTVFGCVIALIFPYCRGGKKGA